MSENTDLPNVSMANTKKELLEAYEEAKEQFESLSKDLLDAEKARKRLEKKVAAATADSQAGPEPEPVPESDHCVGSDRFSCIFRRFPSCRECVCAEGWISQMISGRRSGVTCPSKSVDAHHKRAGGPGVIRGMC